MKIPQTFYFIHGLSHKAIRAMQRVLTHILILPSTNCNARALRRACLKCRRSKVNRHTASPFSLFAAPNLRADHIHVNIISKYPLSNNYTYLVTCINRFTRWVEPIPIHDIHVETVTQVFVNSWVSTFFVPSCLTTHRGRQFQSALFLEVITILGT